MEARTQKAKGIGLLEKAGLVFYTDISPLPFHLVSTDNDVYSLTDYFNGLSGGQKKIFGRPCPIQPRHGFVDSRWVKDPADAHKLFLDARKADPDAELILMPMINATHNAIWTPGSLTVGPGNDGATSGKDAINGVTKNQVARMLKGFEIRPPKDIRFGDKTLKGYQAEWFSSAFERYLPQVPSPSVLETQHPQQSNKNEDLDPIFETQQGVNVADGKSEITTEKQKDVADVAFSNRQKEPLRIFGPPQGQKRGRPSYVSKGVQVPLYPEKGSKAIKKKPKLDRSAIAKKAAATRAANAAAKNPIKGTATIVVKAGGKVKKGKKVAHA